MFSEVIIDKLPGDVFLIQHHKCGGVKQIPVVFAERQIGEVSFCGYKDVLDGLEREKFISLPRLRAPHQSEVNLLFLQ